ncbi:MAG: YqeG family HAD IIIA-type phosphatase [Oscillospiraceae bacterium]|nr:YqeG family HAD IIIA-type phosphatase [Oscillospiraceae bacterium]
MSSWPVPHYMVNSIYDIDPVRLRDMGINLLLLDLDNTMSPYHIRKPSPALKEWINGLKANKIDPFILSNNNGKKPEIFARELEIGFARGAKKPSRKMLRLVMAEKNVPAEKTAIVGDQIYTDVLCGRRAGITTIAVNPIDLFRNPFLALRYLFEFPFRLFYKVKNGK